MSNPRVFNQDGIKILCVADIRGELSLFNKLAKDYSADVIVHTGNFGFLDKGSIDRIHESYLRHVVEFSPLLSEELIIRISKLSKVTGDNVEHLSNDDENLKTLLKDQPISELEQFIKGELKLEVPVYTIYGMCEDSLVINKFKYGVYDVPNLHIVDDGSIHTINLNDGRSLLFAGIGGSFSYHKLFHQGSAMDLKDIIGDPDKFEDLDPDGVILPVSGDPGNIWITFLQLGKLVYTLTKFSESNPELFNRSIKIFISHQSPSREPLIEHLSIFFKMDYTISNSLHFKYSSSYNELSINPSFESFKLKFSEARNKLASIWKNIQFKFERLLFKLNDPMMITCIEMGLEIFDKIPISTKGIDDILPLQLSQSSNDENDMGNNGSGAYTDSNGSSNGQQTNNNSNNNDVYKSRELNNIIRQLNDLYYVAFQNTWHFNLCDLSCGALILNIVDGRVEMEMSATGFDFNFRLEKERTKSLTPSLTTSSTTGTSAAAIAATPTGKAPLFSAATTVSSTSKSETGATKNNKHIPGFLASSPSSYGSTNSSYNSSTRGRGRGRGRGGASFRGNGNGRLNSSYRGGKE
ncbi:unnamed protein product [[Candida] boidinii]|nr:unnamed protein product [[Candida] boidinii]